MKLALFSYHITEKAVKKITEMMGKEPAEIKVVYVTTAANIYDKNDADWLWETYEELKHHYTYIEEFDVEKHEDKDQDFFYDYFKDKDIVFLSGGNVFYLNYWMKKTNAENALESLIFEEKIMYAGASAGAIYPMHDIGIYRLADKPEKAPQLINRGMGIIDFAVLPHWGEDKYQKTLEKIKEYYHKKTVETHELYDDEALLVNGRKLIKI